MDSQTSTREVWKPVYGWEDRYEVSSFGRVQSIQYHGRYRKTPKQLSTHVRGCGYLSVPLNKPGVKCLRQIHALVLEAFVRPRPEGLQVRHLNGIPDDNRLRNLKWGTAKENQADRKIHGTSNAGEEHPMAKLKKKDVIEIRRLRNDGLLLTEIAENFGVSFGHVSDICTRKVWKDV